MIDEKWSLENIPPKGHKDVAGFAFSLYEIARREKERLNKNEDFTANYALYRGKSPAGVRGAKLPVQLYFSNIERTVANITARNPTGEVVDLDGYDDDGEKILSAYLLKWWKNTGQREKTKSSARAMEVYGLTIEKPVWCKTKNRADIRISDPFAFFPAPGKWENIGEDMPFGCYVYLENIDKVEADFKVKGIAEEDAYQLLGAIREEFQADVPVSNIGNYASSTVPANKKQASDKKIEQCLKIEVWMRDNRTQTVTEETPILDENGIQSTDNGKPLFYKTTSKVPIYPDGVRVVTIVAAKGDENSTESGYMVLEDCVNPNINPALPTEMTSRTHPWGRFPMYHATSYDDLVTIWGFAAAEQVGDLIQHINKIVLKLLAYVHNVMVPPLIVQKHCGINKADVESCLEKGGRLLFMPTIPNARIEFMAIPNLPATFFQVLDLIVRFFDRVYAMEEADRGQAPKGVVAASAITALQERNAVLMQPKTSSIEFLAENRSKWAIGLLQNFGSKQESVDVADEKITFAGADFIGRKFGYMVETGSTMPKTALQLQELAPMLWGSQAIDRKALLVDMLKIPGGLEIVERMGETQLDAALNVMIEAGLPEEEAIALKQNLLEPGQLRENIDNKTESQKTATPGIPKARQGER
jgi:hypothetical protein